MGAENSPVCVDFINNNKLQIAQEGDPLWMIRQDPRVEHIRICNNNAPVISGGHPD